MVAIRDGEDNASRKDLFHGEEIVGSVVKYSTKKRGVGRCWRLGSASRPRAAARSTPDLATPAYSMEPEQLNLLANTLADLKSRSAEMRRLL
ncbi:MAG TPA: hypothetical protein VFQ55_07015 [Casimicrobiaceae bacterium]|nr:hypothetical protein [Casimicrobiaceae bacterium]